MLKIIVIISLPICRISLRLCY